MTHRPRVLCLRIVMIVIIIILHTHTHTLTLCVINVAHSTEYDNNSKDAILPAVLAIFAFVLSLAGWWLAWIAGLIAMALWVLAMCCDLPVAAMKAALVAAVIAFVGEVLVAIRVFDATISFTELSTTNLTIVSIVACVLWAVVSVISYRRYW